MKPKILLRVASIVMVLHDVGHMGGALHGSKRLTRKNNRS